MNQQTMIALFRGRDISDPYQLREILRNLQKSRYGNFQLTEAIRLPYNLVVPKSGFRHDGAPVSMVRASASQETILNLFFDLLDLFGETVDVVLETSHDRNNGSHLDLFREHIDLPVLKSILYDFEDLLLNDGCCGIAVVDHKTSLEVQFDEHKLLIAYGQDLSSFENTLIDHAVNCDEELKFITEDAHIHVSGDEYAKLFDQLKCRLGVEIPQL